MKFNWARFASTGYEVSSAGDREFSAFQARMPDGRTLEEWYQCDVKGYDVGGANWRLGKGKPSARYMTSTAQLAAYVSLWRLWALYNVEKMGELFCKLETAGTCTLTDRFATSDINQAHALSIILNEYMS